jgi:hypothetical protein
MKFYLANEAYNSPMEDDESAIISKQDYINRLVLASPNNDQQRSDPRIIRQS